MTDSSPRIPKVHPPITKQGDGKDIKTEYTVETLLRPKKTVFRIVKRLCDILVSLSALIVLCIPMGIIAIAVRLDSRGPAIYRQSRVGAGGKEFMLYKFRSMRTDAEKNGAVWAKENDDRITRVGRFIRLTRLDEIPQFWNILVGQMSLVGPRPERKFFYDVFETYVHGFSQRLLVPPGLTGLAQVNGGYDLLPEEKIVYDAEYIKHFSFSMDIKCIFKTFSVIFGKKGAR